MIDRHKETVIIVHGTWAAPEPGVVKWYQPRDRVLSAPGEFVAKLDAELEKRGSLARCWAHCKTPDDIYTWSGENDWVDRINASSSLAATVNRLQSENWGVHLVAHSHGGNVAVGALPELAPSSECPTGLTGTVTTLGTPFIDAMSPIAKRSDRRMLLLDFIGGIGVFLFCMVVPGMLMYYVGQRLETIAFLLMLVLLLYAGAKGNLPRQKGTSWQRYFDGLKGRVPLLILNMSSPRDEARQVLYHLRNAKDPIAPTTGPLAFTFRSWRQRLSQANDIERIRGAAKFSQQSLTRRITAVLLYCSVIIAGVVLVESYRGKVPAIFDQEQVYFDYLKSRSKEPTLVLGKLWAAGAADHSDDRAWRDYVNKLQKVEIATFSPVERLALQRYVQKARRDAMILAAAVTSLLAFSAASFLALSFGFAFLSLMWFPFRWMARQIGALNAVPSFVGSFIVRCRAWPLLLKIAMGLDSYPISTLPSVELTPGFMPAECVKYEDMPAGAEVRAMAKREDWMQGYFAEISGTFSKLVLTSADVSELLQSIEQDLSLVHAAYYTDDECIERIADWIARKGEERYSG